jgi:hypothetical protein
MNLAKRKLAVDFTLAAFFAGFVESPMSTPQIHCSPPGGWSRIKPWRVVGDK